MRVPWRKQPEGNEVVVLKGERKKETLIQTAEKILQRKMKRDPDGYGLEAAERIRGIRHEAPKTLSDFMTELRQYKAALREVGLDTEAGNKNVLSQIMEAVAALPKLIQEARQVQSQMQAQGYQLPQSIHQAQLTKPPDKSKASLEAPLPTLVDLMALSPQQAFERLQSEPGWLEILRGRSPEQIVAMIKPFTDHPEHGQHVRLLVEYLESEQGRKWLQCIIALVQNA